MLKDRIISTLKFFDLQDTPLTLFELHKFLLADLSFLKQMLNFRWELVNIVHLAKPQPQTIGLLLETLETQCSAEIESSRGYYALKGRGNLINQRLENYFYGIKREKLIKKYLFPVCHIPFVRGVGLVGSQPLGQQKPTSDIDLLILVAPEFLWLSRMLVTAYFQVLGLRRYGQNVANRFCLNHYVTEGQPLSFDRNLYTAAEYLKMRPLVYPERMWKFCRLNSDWIGHIFPDAEFMSKEAHLQSQGQSWVQRLFEKLLISNFGRWLEKQTKKPQYERINVGEFIVASDSELSFHPDNRKQQLFERFFQ
jgi:predicted nucleotidyltransferase